MPLSRTGCMAVALLVGSTLATAAPAATPVPQGAQFLVATLDVHTGGGATMDGAGNLVVSWNYFFGGPGARGFSSNGAPAATFTITPYGGLVTTEPMDSAALATNDFAFVWEGSFEGLQARRYTIGGMPLAPAVQVTPPGGSFFDVEPAIAGWAPGTDMLIAWSTDNPATGDTSGLGIDLRAFDAAGSPLGPVIRINGHTAGDQQAPDIAVAANNGFLVVWQSAGSDGTDNDGTSIQGHRFTAGGQGGVLFQVNSLTAGDQERPAVALAGDGRALVVWEGASAGSDPDGSIQGRLVSAAGVPLGTDFQINTTTGGTQSRPSVAFLGEGCFQVVWRSGTRVYSQVVSIDGSLSGPEEQVNEPTDLGILRLNVAANATASVISWAEDDLSDFDPVFARRYRPQLFADGFESGDTSVWSETVP